MITAVCGNFLIYTFTPSDTPDGYSMKKICYYYRGSSSFDATIILGMSNRNTVPLHVTTNLQEVTFPTVNGENPNFFSITVSTSPTYETAIMIGIEEFGQKPSFSYFDRPFTPVNVKNKDGSEYNTISANQFSQRG